jgi:hypothetical protein
VEEEQHAPRAILARKRQRERLGIAVDILRVQRVAHRVAGMQPPARLRAAIEHEQAPRLVLGIVDAQHVALTRLQQLALGHAISEELGLVALVGQHAAGLTENRLHVARSLRILGKRVRIARVAAADLVDQGQRAERRPGVDHVAVDRRRVERDVRCLGEGGFLKNPHGEEGEGEY